MELLFNVGHIINIAIWLVVLWFALEQKDFPQRNYGFLFVFIFLSSSVLDLLGVPVAGTLLQLIGVPWLFYRLYVFSKWDETEGKKR